MGKISNGVFENDYFTDTQGHQIKELTSVKEDSKKYTLLQPATVDMAYELKL